MTPIILPSPAESLGRGSSSQILKGTGTSVPSGVDGIILYNELTMNNRSWLDTIVITKIDGFGDPDIRDEREVNPQRDGETAFDSFYGGRPLVLTGFIRAFTFEKLKDIKQALKTAFLSLEEKPMVFQGPTFETTSQIWCKKNAPITWSDEYHRDDMFVLEFMITLRASNPSFVSLDVSYLYKNIGVIDGFSLDTITQGHYEFLAGEGTIKVEKELLAPTSTANKRFGRSDLVIDYPEPLVSYEYQPATSLAGSKVGAILKYLDNNNYLWAYIDASGAFHIGKVDEGVSTEFSPLVVNSGSLPVTTELTSTYRVRFEMRDGKIFIDRGFKGFASTVNVSFALSVPDLIKFGSEVRGFQYADITPGSVNWRIGNLIFSAAKLKEEEVAQVVNNGNYEAKPLISIRGPILNPLFTNWSTGEALVFKIGTFIAGGDYLDIDIANGTLVDKNGNNKFNLLDPSSSWPSIAPGSNAVTLSGTDIGGSVDFAVELVTGITIQHRHSWF